MRTRIFSELYQILVHHQVFWNICQLQLCDLKVPPFVAMLTFHMGQPILAWQAALLLARSNYHSSQTTFVTDCDLDVFVFVIFLYFVVWQNTIQVLLESLSQDILLTNPKLTSLSSSQILTSEILVNSLLCLWFYFGFVCFKRKDTNVSCNVYCQILSLWEWPHFVTHYLLDSTC